MSIRSNGMLGRAANWTIPLAAISIALLIASEFSYEAVLFLEFEDIKVIYTLILALLWLIAILRATKVSLAILGIMIFCYCLAAYGTLGSSVFITDIPESVLREEQRKYEVADTLFIAGTLTSLAGYLLLAWQYRRANRTGNVDVDR